MRLLSLALVLFSFSAQASLTIKTQIHDIDYGAENEEMMILLKSGHVAWIPKKNPKTFNKLFLTLDKDQWINFTLNRKNELMKAELTNAPLISHHDVSESSIQEDFIPTVLENLDTAKKYFNESKYVNKESQCFNRAHIWSYEWFIKHNVASNKTWVFFTRRYIRKFKFEWWFHVSPSVAVKEGEVVREKIMDVKYSRGPVDLKRWTDIFMKDDANCPQVQNYSDYANYPESGSCYTMRTSMFYYQPFDIETRENWGSIKANWYEPEIKQAYLEAFNEEI